MPRPIARQVRSVAEMNRRRRVDRLVNDIDDALFDIDPYGYMDAADIIGGSFDDMRTKTRECLRSQLYQKDSELLDGLCNIRRDYKDNPRLRKTVRRLDGLIRRTKRLFGSD
ncbi:hypothetical protein AR505_0341 [methanogenic archaeon ISO4-H5]|nr:hypothetical protein AR505_0341 [methanogenic archaeon ISO4-H5]